MKANLLKISTATIVLFIGLWAVAGNSAGTKEISNTAIVYQDTTLHKHMQKDSTMRNKTTGPTNPKPGPTGPAGR